MTQAILPSSTNGPGIKNAQQESVLLCEFDVLGFTPLLKRLGLNDTAILLSELVLHVESLNDKYCTAPMTDERGHTHCAVAHCDFKSCVFSDTLLVWMPFDSYFIWRFMEVCAEIMCGALERRVPLRGALAAGPCILESVS